MPNERMLSALAIVTMLLAVLFTAIALPGEGGAPSKAPPLKTGHITSDESWDQDYFIKNLVIDKDVIVKVAEGVVLYMDYKSFFYVEGTFILGASEAEPILLQAAAIGNDWAGLVINETGTAHFENFTIQDADDVLDRVSLTIRGLPSIIKNGHINGGYVGIELESYGGHLIETMLIDESAMIGLNVIENELPTTVRDLRVHKCSTGISLSEVGNLTVEDIAITGFNTGISMYGCEHISFSNVSMVNPVYSDYTTGIYYGEEPKDIWFEDIFIDNCSEGIIPSAQGGGVVHFNNLRTGEGVKDAVFLVDPMMLDQYAFLEMIDSDLNAFGRVFNITDLSMEFYPQNTFHIDLINTTRQGVEPDRLHGQGFVNISWYLDIWVRDGAGNPVDSTVRFKAPGLSGADLLLPEGRLLKYPLLSTSLSFKGSSNISYVVEVTSNGPDGSTIHLDNVWLSSYESWELTIDLEPYNDMPDSLDILEDEWYETDLYDHFFDPEGKELSFTFAESPEIQVVHPGGKGSGTMRARNSEPNWYGTGWVMITAEDEGGNATEKNVTINVLSVNDPPYFTEPIPTLVVQEDNWTTFDFTGKVADVEGGAVDLEFSQMEECTLDYNETSMVLTITPARDYFGEFDIDVNLTDGEAWAFKTVHVNVTPVNDPPSATIRWRNGTEVPKRMLMVEGEGTYLVHTLTTMEDTPVDFYVDATDIDSRTLNYSVNETLTINGLLYAEVKEVGNTTVTVPENFTYSPAINSFEGDWGLIYVTDGIETILLWLEFNVTSVNDPPPSPMQIHYDPSSVHIGTIVSFNIDPVDDLEGDELTYHWDLGDGTMASGLSLKHSYGSAGSYDISVWANDGRSDSVKLHLTLNVTEVPGGEHPYGIDELIVTPEEDGWSFHTEGEAGLTLYIVIVDDEDNRESFRLEEINPGEYEVFIYETDGKEGFRYYLSDQNGGNDLAPSLSGDLPALKEGDIDEFNWTLFCCLALVVVMTVLLIALLIVLSARKKKEATDWEE